jgi:hypothetical protein
MMENCSRPACTSHFASMRQQSTLAQTGTVTLLHGSRDAGYSSVVALQKYLETQL